MPPSIPGKVGELPAYRGDNIHCQWIENLTDRRDSSFSKDSRQRWAGVSNRATGLKWKVFDHHQHITKDFPVR